MAFKRFSSPIQVKNGLLDILRYVLQSERPARKVIAVKLTIIADRVAGVKRDKLPEGEVDSWKDYVKRNKGKHRGPGGLMSGQKYKYQGKDWVIVDFDAEKSAPGGATLVLVSPDFKETVRGVEVEEKGKKAGLILGAVKDPMELQKEIHRILVYVNRNQPSRHMLASALYSLAGRTF
jgi:hypothetical protein